MNNIFFRTIGFCFLTVGTFFFWVNLRRNTEFEIIFVCVENRRRVQLLRIVVQDLVNLYHLIWWLINPAVCYCEHLKLIRTSFAWFPDNRFTFCITSTRFPQTISEWIGIISLAGCHLTLFINEFYQRKIITLGMAHIFI